MGIRNFLSSVFERMGTLPGPAGARFGVIPVIPLDYVVEPKTVAAADDDDMFGGHYGDPCCFERGFEFPAQAKPAEERIRPADLPKYGM